MLEWLRLTFNNALIAFYNFFTAIANFFNNFFSWLFNRSDSTHTSLNVAEDTTQNLDASNLQEEEISSRQKTSSVNFTDLIKNAENDVNAAIELISHYSNGRISLNAKIFEIIIKHQNDKEFAKLVIKKVHLESVALQDIHYALDLIQATSFRDGFTALSLANIYSHYKNDRYFQQALSSAHRREQERKSNKKSKSQARFYTNGSIFTISEVLEKAKNEGNNIINRVRQILIEAGLIQSSHNLESSVANEETKAELASAQETPSVNFPDLIRRITDHNEVNAAIELLNHYQNGRISNIEIKTLFDIIWKFRKIREFDQIINNSTLVQIALHNENYAETLLSSSYSNRFTALELANIYSHHSDSNEFINALNYATQDKAPTSNPVRAKPIFTISEILRKAREENSYEEVHRIIISNKTLLPFTPISEQSSANHDEQVPVQSARNDLPQNQFNSHDVDLNALQDIALHDINAAKELLANIERYPQEKINNNQLYNIIMQHRHQDNFSSLVPVKILVMLAHENVIFAISFLTSSKYREHFNALELVQIYYEHRHKPEFLHLLATNRIYPITQIATKSKHENRFDEFFNIIKQSNTLTFFYIKELLRHNAPSRNSYRQDQNPKFNPNFFDYKNKNDKKSDSEQDYQHQHHQRPPKDDIPAFNPYVILGIQRDATEKHIKQAYTRLSLRYHPDKNQDKDPIACNDTMQKIHEAYELLTNTTKKRKWDLKYPVGQEPDTAALPSLDELPIFNEDEFFRNNDPYEILDANRQMDDARLFIHKGRGNHIYALHAYKFLIQPEKRRMWDEQHPETAEETKDSADNRPGAVF